MVIAVCKTCLMNFCSESCSGIFIFHRVPRRVHIVEGDTLTTFAEFWEVCPHIHPGTLPKPTRCRCLKKYPQIRLLAIFLQPSKVPNPCSFPVGAEFLPIISRCPSLLLPRQTSPLSVRRLSVCLSFISLFSLDFSGILFHIPFPQYHSCRNI